MKAAPKRTNRTKVQVGRAASIWSKSMKEPIKLPNRSRTIFDLDTMQEVSVEKAIPDFQPVEDASEALKRLNGDAAKLLEVINAGLQDFHVQAALRDPSNPWLVTDGEEAVPFTGTPADTSVVNKVVAGLMQGVFGFAPLSREESKALSDTERAARKAAKEAARKSALDLIRSNETIRAGIQKTAAL